MILRVHITPSPTTIADDNGIGRIVHAQYRDLPQHGIELVNTPAQADVIACHIEGRDLARVDVLHTHGLYFSDIPHAPYAAWHHQANQRITATARRAHTITVPSEWVAGAFKRDMRISPVVIGHGVDLAQWEPVEHKGYALWNKNRSNDVCSPAPAIGLADMGVHVISTFGPKGRENLTVTGTQPHERMRVLVQHAAVYLATTPETFGIGTLEAMAAGVPVLGYNWCGTADLVRHEVDGYLVEPGDVQGLRAGYDWCLAHRAALSTAARERAQGYGWDGIMARYADLYYATADALRSETHRVSVVITNFNYHEYLTDAINSCLVQTLEPDEVIVVDDGSTDDSVPLLRDIAHISDGLVRLIAQENQGVAAARNNGIAAATGDYIVCLDADDALAPDYLRLCAGALRADRGLGIAYTGLGLLQEDGSVSPSRFPPAFDWEAQATPANPPSTTVPTAAMFRRSLWERAGGYKQVYAPGEDAEFYTRGLSIGCTARKVEDAPLIHYRVHAGSASRTKQYQPIDTWHPWMRDGHFPMAAPAKTAVSVRSYALPLISVIVPVGPGHARYLPAALDSLLGQTFRAWEVIAINDTGDLLKEDRAYPFVRWADTGTAGAGAGFARNLGIELARAPFVVFLDADDWLHPAALERMLRTYAEYGQYAYTDWVQVTPESVTPQPARDYDARAWLPQGATPAGLHAVTALIPTEQVRAVGGFDPDLTGWEDWDFYCKLAVAGICGRRVPEPLLYYRAAAGTRREGNYKTPGLHEHIKARYAPYVTGREPIMACCGQQANLMQRAAQALHQDQYMGGEIPDGQVLIRYMGKMRGSVIYSGSNLRGRYTVSADTPLFLVDAADADWFTGRADFRREDVAPPPMPAPVATVAASAPTVAAVVTVAAAALTAPMEPVGLDEASTFVVPSPEQVAAVTRQRGRAA